MQEQIEIPKKFCCHFSGKIMLHPVKVIRRLKDIPVEGEGIICEHALFHQKFSMHEANSTYLIDLRKEINDFLILHPQFSRLRYVQPKKGKKLGDGYGSDNAFSLLSLVKKTFQLSNSFFSSCPSSDNDKIEVNERSPLIKEAPK